MITLKSFDLWPQINSFLSSLLRPVQKYSFFLNEPVRNSTLVKKIQELIRKKKAVGIIYFDVVNFHEIDQLYGVTTAHRLINFLQHVIEEKVLELLQDSEIIAVQNLWADDFVVYFAPEERPPVEKLHKLAITLRLGIKEQLNRNFPLIASQPLDLHVGHALIGSSTTNIVHQLYAAVKEAQKMAKGTLDLRTVQLLDEFKKILENRELATHYQPIVSLDTGDILGWEALTRGPQNSYFHSPGILFPFAEEVDLLYPLEKISRELAIAGSGGLGFDQKLFLNINPHTINDPNFVKGETKNLLQMNNLKSHNIVFEITERHTITDFANFNRTLEHYRSQGYMIAVDDAGAGYSSLQTIAEIHPDFIKMDMSLVRGINKSPVKKALLETFVTFAQKIGCAIIAEGIETEEEMTTLIAMGIHYGQGFYLARPSFPKPLVEPVAYQRIAGSQTRNRENRNRRHAMPIGNIIESAMQVTGDRPVREVEDILKTNEPVSGVVVMDQNRPVGLVMRHHLHRYLGSQYGVALYLNRPVSTVMDGNPMIVDANTTIETVAQIAMNRESLKLYDHIIITRGKLFEGIVSVQNLLDTITRIKIETAHGANPLTGLPGNLRIEEEIDERLRGSDKFSIIYADLDNFKIFNDKYGFDAGDRLLLLTSKIIGKALNKCGNCCNFLGHIGGDDFVFVTTPEKAEEMCARIIKIFNRLIPRLYNREDREKRSVLSFDRDGQQCWFPLVSISLAIIDCLPGQYTSHIQVAEVAADLKHFAKSHKGSVYVKNRREAKNVVF